MTKKKGAKSMIEAKSNSSERFEVDDPTLKEMFPDGMTKAEILQYAPDDYELMVMLNTLK